MSWPKVSKEYAKLALGLRRGTSVRSSAAQLQIIMPRSLKKTPVTVLNFID